MTPATSSPLPTYKYFTLLTEVIINNDDHPFFIHQGLSLTNKLNSLYFHETSSLN